MWRWACVLTGLVMIASPAAAGSLSGTWKGTINGVDPGPLNVQLRLIQQGTSFKGTGESCPQSVTPGCAPGTELGSVSFHVTFLSPSQAGAFTLQFDGPPVTIGPHDPAPLEQPCVFFWSAIGSLSNDRHALNFLLRGQDGECNPILGLINAAKQ